MIIIIENPHPCGLVASQEIHRSEDEGDDNGAGKKGYVEQDGHSDDAHDETREKLLEVAGWETEVGDCALLVMDGIEEVGHEDEGADGIHLIEEGSVGVGVGLGGYAHEDEVEDGGLDDVDGEADEEDAQISLLFCAPVEAPELEDIGDGVHKSFMLDVSLMLDVSIGGVCC